MTLSDIISKTRGKLGDTSFDSGLITDAANWFVNSLFFNNATRMMESSDILYPSAADTEVDMPDDFQTLVSLNCISPQIYELKNYHMEYQDFMKRFPAWNSTSTVAAAISYWTDFSNQVRFSAPLAADTELAIDYLRLPVAMANLTDTCEVPDQYQELVILGTLARCMDTNEDYPEASQELANLSPLITAFIANESRGQFRTGPAIMRSNRRRGGIRRSPWSE